MALIRVLIIQAIAIGISDPEGIDELPDIVLFAHYNQHAVVQATYVQAM